MKVLSIALASAVMTLTLAPQVSEAGSKTYRKHGKSYIGRRDRSYRQFSRRDYDRLPIRITNPPNTGAYQYRDYPLWAARAFAPNDGTR